MKLLDAVAESVRMTPDRRRSFLDTTCAEETPMRRQVEELLARYERLKNTGQLDRLACIHEEERFLGVDFSEYYELGAEIGRGAAGIVYRARDLMLNREVVVKKLRKPRFSFPEEIERFLKEARTASALNHPNIVHVYAFGEHQGSPCLAMEFVDGQSLAERLRLVAPSPENVARTILKLARAVDYAHDIGVLHLDLKPNNVLLTKENEPKIGDFGVATWIGFRDSTASEGDIIGTPSYMAPEQAEGRTTDIDRATDVYGLGAILYETLTGRPPFRGESPQAILK